MARTERKRVERKSPGERAAEIRAAARALALDEGLAALTLRAVAARAGVAPALVAHYEPSMEALVAETFTTIVSAELVDVRAVTDGERGARGRLRRLVSTTLAPTRDDITAVWVDAWSIGRRNDALAAAVREQSDAWAALIASVIRDGVRAGEFHTDDADGVAWHLLGLIDGLNAQSLIHARNDPGKVRRLQRAIERELEPAPGG